jgi:hypothetical protein
MLTSESQMGKDNRAAFLLCEHLFFENYSELYRSPDSKQALDLVTVSSELHPPHEGGHVEVAFFLIFVGR